MKTFWIICLTLLPWVTGIAGMVASTYKPLPIWAKVVFGIVGTLITVPALYWWFSYFKNVMR